MSNVKKTDYIIAIKDLIISAEKSFLVGKAEEAVEFISTAISRATTQAAKAIEELEKLWKTD